MLKRKDDMPVNPVENPRGGEQFMYLQPLLTGDELQSVSKAFGRITLPPGASIGYHQHVGDIEAYYILSGTAVVRDDEKEDTAGAGDLLFTGDGHWHSIANRSDEPVEFIGLILNARREII